MSNVYYTPTGNPVATTKGLSGQMRSEFLSLQTAFDGVQAKFLLKADLIGVGQSWSGSHNYTGTYTYTAATIVIGTSTVDFSTSTVTLGSATGVTPGAGDSTTKLATTAFVTSATFSAVLPNQTGKQRGSVLVTDGSGNADWSSPPIGSVLYLAQFSAL